MHRAFIKTVAIPILFLALSGALSARETTHDKSMYTINPKAKISGPILQENGREKFNSEIFKIIIKEAHQRAAKYLESKNPHAYWSFLTLALTVPFHESDINHFREVDNKKGLCIETANNGVRVQKRAGARGLRVFKKYFKAAPVSFVPNCGELSRDDTLTQLIHGPDAADVGIMQVNLVWNEKPFAAPGHYKGVQSTIAFGQDMLMEAYDELFRNKKKYWCLTMGKSKQFSYDYLIRGTWAGRYNGGHVSGSCRFANSKSPYAGNDKHFKLYFDKILNYQNSGVYKMGEREMAAFAEIIENHRNGTNKTEKIKPYIE